MASNSIYHQSCSIKFSLGRDPDVDCYGQLAKKSNTVSGLYNMMWTTSDLNFLVCYSNKHLLKK